MKIKNECGEVITTVCVILAIASFLFGTTKYAKIFGFGGSDQKTKQVTVTKTESKPYYVKAEDGTYHLLEAVKTETSTIDTNEEVKMTLWQKLKLLPMWWLILTILGFFFVPLGTIMGILNRSLWAKLKQIVTGVDNSLTVLKDDPSAIEKIKTELSKEYDTSTKELVKKIKVKL